MTTDFNDQMVERDNDLIKGLRDAARGLRMEIREWIQREVKAVLYEAELLETRAIGEIKKSITGAIERLRAIDNSDLRDAVVAYDDIMQDVESGGYENVDDAHQKLRDGLAGFQHLMRELLHIRNFVVEMRNE